MAIKSLLSEQLICLAGTAASSEEALEVLGNMLVKERYVNSSYVAAIKKRELEFPTGINLAGMGVAIPHATPENNVLENGIAILRLKEPVKFYSMENPEEEVSVSIVFMLALCGSERHICMLQRLFGMFQQADMMKELQDTQQVEQFCEIVRSNLQ